VRDLVKKHGKKAAATSYGPYQVMLFEAWRIGYRVSPEELSDPVKSKEIAKAYIKNTSSGKTPPNIFKIQRKSQLREKSHDIL
jgi:hypothetical protein